jgi:translation initiation factor 1A
MNWGVFDLGKRKVLSESHLKELVTPQKGELLGRVIKLVGGDNIIVRCTDGKIRTCRIRGKIKRRMWIRDNDLVLIAPWDFQSDKADIVWRYITAHADKLEQEGYLDGLK